jgi:hypothetical protein
MEGTKDADARSRAVSRTLANGLRVGLYALLAPLEYLLDWIFGSLAALLLLMVLFFKVLLGLPHFPAGLMLLLALGSALIMAGYYLLMRALEPKD